MGIYGMEKGDPDSEKFGEIVRRNVQIFPPNG
jgi:hypothetical protein